MPLSQENRLQMAISAYRSKKIQSKSKAAAVFGVLKSTFINRLDGIQPHSETRASGHKLTAVEEESLVKQLLNADKRGFSVWPEFLRGMAQIFVNVQKIPLQSLESTGPLPLLNAVLNYVQGIIRG